MKFDRRITPFRPEVAAQSLRGQVEADRFVDGEVFQVRDAVAPMRAEPRPDAAFISELLLGEAFTVYDRDAEGWAWGQGDADGYVGWVPANALAAPDVKPTHRVIVPRTHCYPIAGFKAPPLMALGLGARLSVTRIEERHAATPHGFIRLTHLAPLAQSLEDFVTVAETLVDTPYIWGGRSAEGCDCSGLVQLAMGMAGLYAPRDSDMQEREVGAPLSVAADGLQRGDLVFWKGHVGIMQDASRLLHANVWHMAVASEPLVEAIARIVAQGGGAPTSYRRPASLSGQTERL